MTLRVLFAGLGVAALAMACGDPSDSAGSDPAGTELGEATEALGNHSSRPRPSRPQTRPSNAGGVSSSDGSSSSGSVAGGTSPSRPAEPGCGVPPQGPSPACPQQCPVIDICQLCPDGSCAAPQVACNADGSCGKVTFSCTDEFAPCAGKKEGDSCTACDPKDTDCVESSVVKTCQSGACEAAAECPSRCPVPAICQVCADGGCADAIVACNPDGSCGRLTFTCN